MLFISLCSFLLFVISCICVIDVLYFMYIIDMHDPGSGISVGGFFLFIILSMFMILWFSVAHVPFLSLCAFFLFICLCLAIVLFRLFISVRSWFAVQ